MSRSLGRSFVLGGFGLQAGRRGPTFGSAPSVPPGPAPPARIADQDWSLADAGTGGTLLVELLTEPDGRGGTIQGYEIQIDGGAWTASGLSGPGQIALDNLVNGLPVFVALRATSEFGAAYGSAPKTATPTSGVSAFLISAIPTGIAVEAVPDILPPAASAGPNSIQIVG